MEDKSKLGRLALTLVMLQALLLLLTAPLSAFASTEANQEIGIPQPMETRVEGCFGAYLSPNGDRFYSLREGMLTQYQISPFKKLGSVAIDRELTKESGCHVLVTSDEKKLIVVYRRWIYVFDTRSGQLLNKTEKDGQSMPTVISSDDDLLVLDRFVNEADGVSVDLTVWDINTLKVKKSFNQFGRGVGFYPSGGSYPFMSKLLDKVYLKTDKSLLVLNSKTYEPELSLLFGPASDSTGIYDHRNPQRLELPRLTKDFRVLYASSVTKVTDHLNGKETRFNGMKRTDVLVFDQKTREFKIESFESLKLDALDSFIFNPVRSSRNREYVMLLRYPYKVKAALINLSTKVRGDFYQYEAGEAIWQRCSIGSFRDCKEFQLTPGARKHLMMKNSEGKVVPINDVTYSKYYRSDGLY